MKKNYTLKHLFFFCFFLIFTGGLYAQYVSNVQIEYSCPCSVKVTYDLAKDGDVKLSYSPTPLDIDASGWQDAKTWTGQTEGINQVLIWDCAAAGVSHGVFYYKLERVSTPCEKIGGVIINGVCWATRNVDAPGNFAANPEDPGMLYQWDTKVGWNNTDNPITYTTSSPAGSTWNTTGSSNSSWNPDNDPSPDGYRVPTVTEIFSLLNTTNVASAWTTKNGKTGYRFTDISVGPNNGNEIFLPAAGVRVGTTGTLYDVGTNGFYRCSTPYNASYAYYLYFFSSDAGLDYDTKIGGLSVRPVAK